MRLKIDKQTAITLAISFVLALVIVYSGVLHVLVAFLLVGAIPGTTISLPPVIMLTLFGAIAWLLFFRWSIIRLMESAVKKYTAVKQLRRKSTVQKRRYSRI